MNFKNTLLPALFLSALVLDLHITALRQHLYFHNWFFHTVIHILVGLVLSLLTLYIYIRLRSSVAQFTHLIGIALTSVLIFAIGWEIFEVSNDLIYSSGHLYILSTTKDILTGLFGGLLGVVYVYLLQKNQSA